MMGKASECGNHVSECDTLCLMKTQQTRPDGTTQRQTPRILRQSMPTLLIWCGKRKHRWKRASELVPTRSCRFRCRWTLSALKVCRCEGKLAKSNTIQSIAVDRPLQSRDGNEDTPKTEDDEIPEDELVGSTWMSKCRLHNMPICISEFDGCYFSCKDEFVKPSMSRLSDAKMRSPANNRTKEGKEGNTEGLAAEMGRLNDFETVRKNAKERVRKGIDDLKATEEKYNQDGERLKQQGEELKKKADEFRQRGRDDQERHAANLKKERDEMWKTGKEEIEHAHEEEKEAISAAEAKAKEAKKRMVARFNNLKKEEESVLSAAKDKLAALGMKMRAAQLARSPEQEKRRKKSENNAGSAGEAPQGRAQAVAPEENGRGQTRAASDQTEHRAGTPFAAGRGEGAAATRSASSNRGRMTSELW
ncbi:hypothetical protein BLNAU_24053 [Blattamonas nauphoetae]|uniref:Uncharacterized protein n=1 Tax=Blattamonas nauphoetae TaxID=2049346 RepID=A0ABQ9WNJ5_9EUKA|nr:hypothetical protein BLNAU_24053 [Blattamonas nauphoetae]